MVLSDGTELPADLDRLCHRLRLDERLGGRADLRRRSPTRSARCWGLGSDTTKDPGPWEGEQRNMWKPTQQEALWFHGGNLHQSRHYSQFLALQLKARMEGLPTPVYGLPRGASPRVIIWTLTMEEQGGLTSCARCPAILQG